MEGWVDLGGWFTCPQAVTYRSTNRARRTVTLPIGSNALPLHHSTNPYIGPTYFNLAMHKFASRSKNQQFWIAVAFAGVFNS